jgi:hypothetical protein
MAGEQEVKINDVTDAAVQRVPVPECVHRTGQFNVAMKYETYTAESYDNNSKWD